MKLYNQFYTSSLFNIKNNIDYTLKTTFINVFTDDDLKVFNKITKKQVIYNSKLYFFKYLDIVNKVINSGVKIYSDNFRIRLYLFKNGANPLFISTKYIQVDKNIDLNLFKRFEISVNEKSPLIIKMNENIDLIINRLKMKLPTLVVDKININNIEEAICNNRLLYIENTNIFIKNITTNLYVSEALNHFKKRFQTFYNKQEYSAIGNCIFFGMYSNKDIDILKKHQGYKFLIWGGTDCNWDDYKEKLKNLEIINKIPDLYHISISKNIQNRLNSKNIESVFFDLNLVDKKLFKPVLKKGKYVFIYNGFTKGNEKIYGKKIYIEVVKKFPNLKFIYSNKLNLPYEKMPKIYEKCFIGLRLTRHDGNANMVQEMKAMNIPVVHNLSNYGLKWKNIDDIIQYINLYNI